MAVELTFAFPPSANRLWVRTKRGMTRSQLYKDYIEAEQWKAIQYGLGRNPIDGPYFLDIIATRPDKRPRDIDNLIKSTSDTLQHCGIIQNDKDCGMVRAMWADCPPTGELVRVFLK